MKLTEDEEVVVVLVSDVFSSGFESPKVKPPLELLSVLDDPVPNIIPPLVPNLNPEPAAGWSDFLSSLEAAPNLKPSDELPNLNPDEALVSLEVVSDEEIPNLNPPDEEEEDSENEPPNLKPTDPDPEVLSDVPNLKPPELEVEEPEVPPAEEPKDEPKAEEKKGRKYGLRLKGLDYSMINLLLRYHIETTIPLGSTLAPGLAV